MDTFRFCPNPQCEYHQEAPAGERWYREKGKYYTKSRGIIKRYLCKACGKSFSSQTYHTSYFLKKPERFEEVLSRLVGGESLRAMSRAMGCSISLLSNRIDRLGRQGLALHSRFLKKQQRCEDICIDGFVSFDRSQYFPSEIPIAVGADSQFIIDASHCNRRRSGKQTPEQSAKSKVLYASTRMEKGGIMRSFREVLDTALGVQPPEQYRPFILRTDEKPDYARVIYSHPQFIYQTESNRFVFWRTPSWLPRNHTNPLFSSNYTEREIRKDQANHHRESVCFNRDSANGMMRLWTYLVWHNYLKPYRINCKHGKQPTSHAAARGISIPFKADFLKLWFCDRCFFSRERMSSAMEKTWRKAWETPGKANSGVIPRFVFD